MDELTWNPAWDIGHPEIDRQHLKWVEILNRLHRVMLSEDTDDFYAQQKEILREMLDFTRYHFDHEEKIMQEAKYPEAYEHWRQHKELDKKIYEKNRALEAGELLLNSELITLVRTWLISHVQIEDQKLGRYLKSCNQ